MYSGFWEVAITVQLLCFGQCQLDRARSRLRL